jgi:hypothetical protein
MTAPAAVVIPTPAKTPDELASLKAERERINAELKALREQAATQRAAVKTQREQVKAQRAAVTAQRKAEREARKASSLSQPSIVLVGYLGVELRKRMRLNQSREDATTAILALCKAILDASPNLDMKGAEIAANRFTVAEAALAAMTATTAN